MQGSWENIELESFAMGKEIWVRPKGHCGSIGWYPIAWTIAVKKRGETAKEAFLKVNPKWKGII